MNLSLFKSANRASKRPVKLAICQHQHGHRIWILFAEAAFVLGLALKAHSGTYYVDYSSGSDTNNGLSTNTPGGAPGMNGFSGTYSHQAGDQFIFRGGVTWSNDMAPWNISNSGVPGTNDYYGVDTTWFAGNSWTNPVFDGGSQYPVAPAQLWGYWKVAGSCVTLDNITLQNIGVPGTNQGNYAIKVTGQRSSGGEHVSAGSEPHCHYVERCFPVKWMEIGSSRTTTSPVVPGALVGGRRPEP